MNTTIFRRLDLGDLGMHEAKITISSEKYTGVAGEYTYVKSLKVEHKGSTVDLANLIPRDLEADIIYSAKLDALVDSHDE